MATGVQNISLTDYDSQMAEFARRQRMAQALQEQAAAPIEVQAYKGIQAPISSLSILSKVLQSYAGARGERKAIEGKGALDKLARELAAARGSSYMPTEEPAPAPTAVAPQVLAAALGAQPMDTQSGASRAAGIASNPLAVAAPPPAAPPPGMVPNTQSGASIAMGMGPNPNAAPMPMPPAAPPPAPAGAMAPINVPTPRPAGPSVAQIQEALNRATLDLSSSNPRVREQAQSAIPGLNQRLGRAQQQADTADTREYNRGVVTEERAFQSANTEMLRKADVTRATEQAEALIAGGDFSDAQANVIRQTAAAGSEALNAVRSTVMTKAFADEYSILTPEEVRAAGFPVGSVVSKNNTTQDIKLEYNPRPDQTAALNATTAQYNARTSRIAADAARDRSASGLLAPEAIQMRAAQAASGDKSAFQSLGLGSVGAANRIAITNQMTQDLLAQGFTPAQAGARLAQINAQYVGDTAAARTFGSRTGQAEFANVEMGPAVELAKEAYSVLPRGQFVPLNQLRRLVDSGFSSPEQAAALVMDEDAITAYARALNPTGIPRVADIKTGEKLLNGATSIAAHDAALDAMLTVVETRQRATRSNRVPDAPGALPPPSTRRSNF